MRLFGKVDAQITNEDRPSFFGGIFTLAFQKPPTPVPLAGATLPAVYSLPPRLSMYAVDAATGAVLGDLTAAQGVVFGTDRHGFADLRGSFEATLHTAFSYYSRNDPPLLVVTDGVVVAYEGRLEDIGVDDAGMTFGAFGFWRSLSDLRVSALFVDSYLADWYDLKSDEVVEVTPDRYEMDKMNRLYMAPQKDEKFSSATAHCSFGYRVPDLSITQIQRITFSYALDAPSPWRVELSRCDASWNVLEVVWSLTGNGSLQSAAGQVVSVDPCDALRFTLFYNDTEATYSGESGDVYFRATIPVVSAFDKATVCADDIITTLVDEVNDLNPTQLSADTSQVLCPNLSLNDAVYEDEAPAAIVNQLSALGDDQSPPAPWTAAVWEDRRLRFMARGAESRHWFVDVIVFEIERSFQDVVNTAYGVYRENGRGNRRTAVVSRNVSEVVRMEAIDTSTTAQSVAEAHRDSFLSDSSRPRPRAVIRTLGLFDEMGAEYPLYRARAGDRLTLRNLPPDLGGLENLQTFRIGSTRYDAETDVLEPEPEEPIPNLAIMVARRQQGV